jgi:hypothetical protein
MLRLTGITGLPPAILLPIGAALIGLGLWQHLTIALIVGGALLLKGLISAAGGRRSDRQESDQRQGGPR